VRYRRSIHWFRRDLRLADNPALLAAATSSAEVVPLYVASIWKDRHRWTGPGRQEFLCGCLAALDHGLRAAGGRLVVRAGAAVDVLRELIRETRAEAVFFNRAVDPFGRATDHAVRALCREAGIDCHDFGDAVLHEPDEVLTAAGTPFRVFTPFCRAWLKLAPPAPAGRVKSLVSPEIRSLPLPRLADWGLREGLSAGQRLEAGEAAARQRLRDALAGPVRRYARDRDLPAGRTTSRLSQDLRFGLVSIREVVARVIKGMREAPTADVRESHEVFLKELGWRDFYLHILHHFPEVLDHEFNPATRGVAWDHDEEKLCAWAGGLTGFPIVDAGMRHLRATGFMPNRVRMIVSMFLTKDLHLDWRLGEQHFMRHLIDGEIASNNGGWQWSAGTGADAAPYFRIQNPWSQTKRFDPDGAYIKEWVPELRDVPAARLVAPPPDGRPLARAYPRPIVDHAVEREETLRRFKEKMSISPASASTSSTRTG